MNSFKEVSRMEEEPKKRIPQILLSSYQKLMASPSGRSDLKRITVNCGICQLVRYYSLTRGITRVNDVVACEACRHTYQAFKREPVPLQCSKGDGSCYKLRSFPKTKCRCCWIAQIIEHTAISNIMYQKFLELIPEYLKSEFRGSPVVHSDLSLEQRGMLALEVHTGTEWKDVTDPEAVLSQQRGLRRLEGGSKGNNDDDDTSSEAWSGADVPDKPAAVVPVAAPRAKATKSSRGGSAKRGRPLKQGRGGQSKVERLMEGIKEGLYGLSVEEGENRRTVEKSSSNSDMSEPPSGAVSPSPMEEDVTVEEFEEVAKLRQLEAMIGLKHDEQRKILKDFNPRNSARVRRKKDRVDYNDNPKPSKAPEVMVHDYRGRLMGVDHTLHDICDCLQNDCPGCHFPCPKCRSSKCGSECRNNRKWFYEKVDVEGTDQFYSNKFIKA